MSIRSIRQLPLPASAALATVLAATLLAGCAVAPPSTVLSRLPDGQPGAAAAQARPLTPAEKQRYDAIDKQVLREQDEVMSAEAAARAAYYAPAPVTVYGGYYGGWNNGWGYGYGYPGWGWGW
ncbi:hypothetical protein [Burkholderia sp. 22PA0106]|uniref:hypothetical protein n=1 Tax=Burkholderia sp. 22PA0106 TaxID=3237371 RepID=UPI0039C4C126